MTPTVLVLNCGSSSIKYQLVDVAAATALAQGLVERIGEESGRLRHQGATGSIDREARIPDHETGLDAIIDAFQETGPPIDSGDVVAVGHRVVHGGERFAEPVIIDDQLEAAIDELSALAPLHNPPNLAGIRVARKALPDLPHVAVFDTAFHQSLPPAAYTYALDRDVARRLGVRRYGFHGTSVGYVTHEAARFLDRDPARTNLIVLHLGNGASATAVRDGRSVDTSMGLTPLEGLVMGTRTGDLDPGIVFHLHREAGMSIDELDDLFNRRSGMLGLAGANDLREVRRMALDGDADAALAIDVYCRRIRHYVGAYSAELGDVHAVVFTAGVGENAAWVRSRSLAGLKRLGIEVDSVRNSNSGVGPRLISPDGAEVAVLVIPTDEELEIARQSLALARPQAE